MPVLSQPPDKYYTSLLLSLFDRTLVISRKFSTVAPGTKDRLVQITGPNEECVSRAKLLIEDTICRNSSPVLSDNEDEVESVDSSSGSSDDESTTSQYHSIVITICRFSIGRLR
jgi:hypothetical protein